MAKTVVGSFDSFDEARRVVGELQHMGFARDHLSIVANNTHGGVNTTAADMAAQADEATSAAGSGAVTGGVIGGAAGLLAGLAGLALPGIGPVIAAGPIAAALAGAGVGAVTGGLIGGLRHVGVSDMDAEYYAEAVRRGGALVTVRAEDDTAPRAADVMRAHGAVDIEQRVQGWRSEGWSGHDPKAPALSRDEIDRERMARRGAAGSMGGAAAASTDIGLSDGTGPSTDSGQATGGPARRRDERDDPGGALLAGLGAAVASAATSAMSVGHAAGGSPVSDPAVSAAGDQAGRHTTSSTGGSMGDTSRTGGAGSDSTIGGSTGNAGLAGASGGGTTGQGMTPGDTIGGSTSTGSGSTGAGPLGSLAGSGGSMGGGAPLSTADLPREASSPSGAVIGPAGGTMTGGSVSGASGSGMTSVTDHGDVVHRHPGADMGRGASEYGRTSQPGVEGSHVGHTADNMGADPNAMNTTATDDHERGSMGGTGIGGTGSSSSGMSGSGAANSGASGTSLADRGHAGGNDTGFDANHLGGTGQSGGQSSTRMQEPGASHGSGAPGSGQDDHLPSAGSGGTGATSLGGGSSAPAGSGGLGGTSIGGNVSGGSVDIASSGGTGQHLSSDSGRGMADTGGMPGRADVGDEPAGRGDDVSSDASSGVAGSTGSVSSSSGLAGTGHGTGGAADVHPASGAASTKDVSTAGVGGSGGMAGPIGGRGREEFGAADRDRSHQAELEHSFAAKRIGEDPGYSERGSMDAGSGDENSNIVPDGTAAETLRSLKDAVKRGVDRVTGVFDGDSPSKGDGNVR